MPSFGSNWNITYTPFENIVWRKYVWKRKSNHTLGGSNKNQILDTVKLYVIYYNWLIPKISFITESKKNDYSKALKYTCLKYLHKHC